ncbi:MAG TPA: alpha/beta hydrolase [Caulobacteraceae bacterium]|jgi:proline iminopeptidase|nr:alpha/beta hydrolase [Caulobacteraceae bacterium]
MFVEIDGARIFFDTVGSKLELQGAAMVERPSLLVLHGGPGFDHSLMRPWFDRFADTHQVVYVDHRGNGRSGGRPDTWTLARWGDDIDALCRILGIEKPAVLGLSFGGMVAMSYAARHPLGPSRLVLSSTAARLDLQATNEMMERLGGPQARRIAEQFWADPSPEVMADYLAVCMPLYNPSGALGEEAQARAIVRPEVMFHFIRGEQRTMDLRPGLKRVECPTLITAGALDPITPVACSEDILAALPPGVGELLVFDEAGHGVHRDLPDRAEAALRRFLAA